ncbi:MAG: ArnT family glycosyltransferase, partial [Planctomycetota bacterium]
MSEGEHENADPPSKGKPPFPIWPLAAVVVLFVGLRVILIANSYAIPIDAVKYFGLGRCWILGAWQVPMAAQYHPLYPLLLGIFTAPFADPELPARLLSLVFSTATLVPMYYLALPWGGRRGALVTLALFALVPEPMRLSVQVLTEPLYLLCLVTAAASMVHAAKRGDLRLAALSGLASGGAYLTRPEGLVLLAPFALVLALPGRDGAPLKRRALLGAICLGCFLILSGPYMIWIGGITAKKSVSRLAGAGEYRPDERPARQIAGEVERSGKASGLVPWGMVGKSPDHVAREKPLTGVPFKALLLFGKAGHFITPPLFLLGLMLSLFFRRPRGPDIFLASYVLLCLAMVAALMWAYRYASLRHAVPATLLALPLASWGGLELWRLGGRWKPWLSRSLVAICAAAFFIFFLTQCLQPIRHHRRYLEPVGNALRERGVPTDIVLTEDPRYAWYGGKRFLGLGIIDAASLEAEARARGVRFLATNRAALSDRVKDFDRSD